MDMTIYKLNSLCACFPIGTIWSNLSRLQRELTNMNLIKQWMCGFLLNELIELFLHPSREYFIHHAPLRGFDLRGILYMVDIHTSWSIRILCHANFFKSRAEKLWLAFLIHKNYALICDQMISLCQKQLRYIIWL